MTEKDKFFITLAELRKKGLVNLKFARNSNGADSSEEVYAEINRMWAASKLPEKDEL